MSGEWAYTLLSVAVVRAVIAAIKHHIPDRELISPQMNLEIDLGLDSLARAECVVSVEQNLGIELKPEEVSTVQRVGELIQLASARSSGPTGMRTTAEEFHWRHVLSDKSAELPEVAQLVRPKLGLVLFAYVVLRFIYLVARLFFRVEVKGREVLSQLEPPYLICPNHQSYLDPFLVL